MKPSHVFPLGAFRLAGSRRLAYLLLGLVAMIPLAAAQAGDPIQAAGDILQYAMPAVAYGSTIYRFDHPEALQWDENRGRSSTPRAWARRWPPPRY